MLGNTRGKQLNKYVSDYVLYDLETTGISCNYDEVIEISAVKVRGGEVVDEFSELVNPKRSIPYAASKVNNITDSMVANAPTFEEVLPKFIEFVGDDILIGHNICTFDMKFIYRDCEKYFNQTLTNDYIDTLKMAKVVFPTWKHRRLSDLAEYFGISTAGAHRALADCKMNQKVFELLGKELENKGGSSPKAVRFKEAYAMSHGQGNNSEGEKYCPECDMPLVKRNGRFGEFWGCTGFPRCRYTENA